MQQVFKGMSACCYSEFKFLNFAVQPIREFKLINVPFAASTEVTISAG
jgi:hypothetical protein